MQGTITWFDIKSGELPPSDPTTMWDFGTYSKTVMLACGKSLSFSRQAYSPDGKPRGWRGYNLPGAPTHWAFINYPTDQDERP